MKGRRLRIGVWALGALLCASQGAATAPNAPAAPPKRAVVLLKAGHYEQALSAARAAGGPAALTLAGEIERRLSRYADARHTLEQVAQRFPDQSARARLFLGLVYLDTGQHELAEQALDRFYRDYNSGRVDKASATQLLYVAMAARALEGYQDANRTFQRAAELDPKNLEIQLEWGRTFLLRYAVGEADVCAHDALKLDPKSADAHALAARVRYEQSETAGALAEVEAALAEDPHHEEALSVRAAIQIEDGQYEAARRDLAQALAQAPASPRLHALRAAAALLGEDPKTYEEARSRALQVNPSYADFYVQVADLAEKQHRYEEAGRLEEQALALSPKHAGALAALGTNYLRQGDDAHGLALLKRAWESDPFNVRTYNILNLFENVLAKRFAFADVMPFRLRAAKNSTPILLRQVVPLLRHAYEGYVKRYRLTPAGPIVIELYADAAQYAVRTVGLPQLGALGVCFGRVITAMEPGSGQFSWAMVLSHELAHVFALQLSRSRVPRWFTEGLSEWETAQARHEWRRAGDADLAAALAAGTLRPLAELNLGFTRARSIDEMTAAYYHSFVAVDFLARRLGFEKLLDMLKLWGQGKSTAEVLERVSGVPLAKLDLDLRAEIEQRTARFRGQLTVRYDALDLPQREKEAKARPRDGLAQALLGLTRLAARDLAGAEAAAMAAAALAPDAPQTYLLRGEVGMAKRDAKTALASYERALQAGADGFDLRMRLGAAATYAGDLDRALAEFGRAAAFDPQRSEPLEERLALLVRRHDEAAAQAEREKWVAIDPHSGRAARELALGYAAHGNWTRALATGQRALEVNPVDAELLEVLGRAHDALGHRKEADAARETARLARAAKVD